MIGKEDETEEENTKTKKVKGPSGFRSHSSGTWGSCFLHMIGTKKFIDSEIPLTYVLQNRGSTQKYQYRRNYLGVSRRMAPPLAANGKERDAKQQKTNHSINLHGRKVGGDAGEGDRAGNPTEQDHTTH